MKINNVVYYIIVVFSFLIIIILLQYAFSKGGQCLKNPYVYGVREMGNTTCSCTQTKNIECPARFYVNETGWYMGGSCSSPSGFEVEFRNLSDKGGG